MLVKFQKSWKKYWNEATRDRMKDKDLSSVGKVKPLHGQQTKMTKGKSTDLPCWGNERDKHTVSRNRKQCP